MNKVLFIAAITIVLAAFIFSPKTTKAQQLKCELSQVSVKTNQPATFKAKGTQGGFNYQWKIRPLTGCSPTFTKGLNFTAKCSKEGTYTVTLEGFRVGAGGSPEKSTRCSLIVKQESKAGTGREAGSAGRNGSVKGSGEGLGKLKTDPPPPPDVFYREIQSGAKPVCAGSATGFDVVTACIAYVIDRLKPLAAILLVLAVTMSGAYLIFAPAAPDKAKLAWNVLFWAVVGFIIVFSADLLRGIIQEVAGRR